METPLTMKQRVRIAKAACQHAGCFCQTLCRDRGSGGTLTGGRHILLHRVTHRGLGGTDITVGVGGRMRALLSSSPATGNAQ